MGITLPEMLTDYEGRTGGLSLQDLGLIMSALRTRNNELLFSDEVYWMLRIVAKIEGGESGLTADQKADGICRKVLTEQYPELVLAYDRFVQARKDARKEYAAIEEEAVQELRSETLVPNEEATEEISATQRR